MWKSVVGYEGFYEVSDCGEVRSLNRDVVDKHGIIHHIHGRIMKQTLVTPNDGGRHTSGYYFVNLRKPGHSKVWAVHRLVAIAFIQNPDNLNCINHIDGNKLNNNVTNLEWVTYKENNVHALVNNLRKPRGNEVLQFSIDGKFIAKYKSGMEAYRQTGIRYENIYHCLNGWTETGGGFIWKRLSECNDYPVWSTPEDELLAEAQELPIMEEDIVCSIQKCME